MSSESKEWGKESLSDGYLTKLYTNKVYMKNSEIEHWENTIFKVGCGTRGRALRKSNKNI